MYLGRTAHERQGWLLKNVKVAQEAVGVPFGATRGLISRPYTLLGETGPHLEGGNRSFVCANCWATTLSTGWHKLIQAKALSSSG